MNATVRTAVFPLGGHGRRMLPLTHASPKALLPIGPCTLLQYAMHEAVVAGAQRFIFVVDERSGLISHLPRDTRRILTDLSADGLAREATEEWYELLARVVAVVPITKELPGGLAAAIASVEPILDDEWFAVLSTDDIVFEPRAGLAAAAAAHERHGGCAITLTRLSREQFSEFGVVDAQEPEDGVYQITEAVEKPGGKTGYRGYGIAGRYVLNRQIFEKIRHSRESVMKENSQAGFHFTGALNLVAREQKLCGALIEHSYFHAGRFDGYLAAWKHWLAGRDN